MKVDHNRKMEMAARAAKLNRQRFRKLYPGVTLVLEGREETTRNGDVDYSFRQYSDFLHLSACDLPECLLIVGSNIDLLCIPRIDEHHLVWLGDAETNKSAKEKFDFRRCIYTDELEKEWPKILPKTEKFICSEGLKKELSSIAKKIPVDTFQVDRHLDQLRVIKSEQEISLMQFAADASSAAHLEVMTQITNGMYEWEIKDLYDKTLKRGGVRQHSFPTIAGSGKNGAVLHYTKDQTRLKNGDLLLLDAGGEYKGYAADITRTFPVNGKFTKRQKDIYNLVLKAQMESIEMIEPGVWMSDLQENVIRILTEGFLKLGFFKGELEELIKNKCISLFYPHGCSHQLGLDVHDISPPQQKPGAKAKLRSNQRLEAGMVITMEPGIYFIEALINNKEKRKANKAFIDYKKVEGYLNFGGIRIEDDVLVTRDGYKVLSNVPKTVADIEALKKA